MGTASKIEWTDHTFNCWRGCEKVSAGCDNCYAETMSHRNPAVLGEWGADGTRAMAAEEYWKLPFKWNRLAAAEGRRHRVFCLSLGDWLEDRPELIAPRARLLATIRDTPNLDWLLLTKRPEGWRDRMRDTMTRGDDEHGRAFAQRWLCGHPPPNVWAGVSTEDQAAADLRIPALLAIPAAVRFISAEPLLGPIDLDRVYAEPRAGCPGTRHPLNGSWWPAVGDYETESRNRVEGLPRIDWVIVGGESGSGARPMHPDWARSLRNQCQAAGVAYYFKQWGEWAPLGQFDNRAEQRGLCWLEEAGYEIGSPQDPDPDGLTVNAALCIRVGKHAADRVLDGRTWGEVPS